MEQVMAMLTLKFERDIFFLEDELPFNRIRYVVGSPSKGSYISVNRAQFQILRYVHDVTKRCALNLDEIESIIHRNLGKQVDMVQLHGSLKQRGLIEGSESVIINSEVKMVSTPVLNFEMEKIPDGVVNSILLLSKLKPLMVLIFLLGLGISFIQHQTIADHVAKGLFTYQDSTLKGVVVGIIVANLTIILHELAHVFSAICQGMRSLRFDMVLYAKFIPMYYTQYQEFMCLGSRSKIAVLSAGIKSNVFVIIISLAGIGVLPLGVDVSEILMKVILVNGYFVLLNASPFITNDGYFIISNMFGIEGLRLKFWQTVKGVFSGDKIQRTDNFWIRIYVIISGVVLVLSFSSLALWIYGIAVEVIGLVGRWLGV